jgi:hypothetical protein
MAVKGKRGAITVSENVKLQLVVALSQLKEDKEFGSVEKFCEWINTELKLPMTPVPLAALMKRSPVHFERIKMVRTAANPMVNLSNKVAALEEELASLKELVNNLAQGVVVQGDKIDRLTEIVKSHTEFIGEMKK